MTSHVKMGDGIEAGRSNFALSHLSGCIQYIYLRTVYSLSVYFYFVPAAPHNLLRILVIFLLVCLCLPHSPESELQLLKSALLI